MNTSLRHAIVAAFCVLTAFELIASEPKADSKTPALNIEDALGIAQAFVRDRHIDLARSYIDSAHLELKSRGDRGRFWLVTWLRNEYAEGVPIKGGQTYIHVYMDKSAEVFYGE